MSDKALHALLSACLTVVLAVPMVTVVGAPLWGAGLAAAGIGAVRELAQWQQWQAGHAEWGDLAANAVGIVAALGALAMLGVR